MIDFTLAELLTGLDMEHAFVPTPFPVQQVAVSKAVIGDWDLICNIRSTYPSAQIIVAEEASEDDEPEAAEADKVKR